VTQPPPARASSPAHNGHLEAPDEDELIMFLEADQLVADTSQPVPRANLSRTTRAALWGLRIFVLIVSFMVVYTFVHQLG
jgi:hypothetical protein